jgi:hypothetical protein
MMRAPRGQSWPHRCGAADRGRESPRDVATHPLPSTVGSAAGARRRARRERYRHQPGRQHNIRHRARAGHHHRGYADRHRPREDGHRDRNHHGFRARRHHLGHEPDGHRGGDAGHGHHRGSVREQRAAGMGLGADRARSGLDRARDVPARASRRASPERPDAHAATACHGRGRTRVTFRTASSSDPLH